MVYPTHSMNNDVKNLNCLDWVYKFDDESNRVVFGTVVGIYGDDSEAEDCTELQRGQVRVFWYWDVEIPTDIWDQSELNLMSREITAGTRVRKLGNGMRTQTGLCTETKKIATAWKICLKTDTVVQHVDGNRFYNICFPFKVGDAVSFGDKVGRIKSIDRLLRLRSDKCNSMVEVRTGMNEGQFRGWNWTCNYECNYKDQPCYHFQTVSCIPGDLVEPVWIFKSETINVEINQKFLIKSNKLHSVQVYWLLPDIKVEIGEVKGEDVEKLTVLHEPHTVFLGDYLLMKTEPNDIWIEKSKWIKEQTNMLLPDKVKEEKEELDDDSTSQSDDDFTSQSDDDSASQGDDDSTSHSDDDLSSLPDHTTVPADMELVGVIFAETKVTVLWQDGTKEQDIPSTELYECRSQDDHEFFPGDWVELKKSEEDRCGVIQSVDFAERIAKVKWLSHSLRCPCSTCEQSKNFHLTEHSVYDLVKHFSYCLEDIAFKSTANGAMLGKIIDVVPQNGSTVIQWLDGSTEYCSPKSEGINRLPLLNLLKRLSEVEHSSSDDDGSDSESDEKLENVSEAADNDKPLVDENEGFCLLDEAPERHMYHSTEFEPRNMQKFVVAVHREYKLLKESLPAGVWVRAYGNRTDLLSLMIRGAMDTPYEDGLFLFDIKLPADYPENPPQVHFISYIDEKLNPNLYVEGKVCVSLLGTWRGQGSEVWSTNSNLLQLIVSIQGLILVAEPYYNEAGYEADRHSQEGFENSRTYNESAILIVIKSMIELLNTCPREFKSAVLSHFKRNGEKMCLRIESYCNGDSPEYPLLPVSRGLKLSLELHIARFRRTLAKICKDSEPNQ